LSLDGTTKSLPSSFQISLPEKGSKASVARVPLRSCEDDGAPGMCPDRRHKLDNAKAHTWGTVNVFRPEMWATCHRYAPEGEFTSSQLPAILGSVDATTMKTTGLQGILHPWIRKENCLQTLRILGKSCGRRSSCRAGRRPQQLVCLLERMRLDEREKQLGAQGLGTRRCCGPTSGTRTRLRQDPRR
jgi:hypothetical protein